MEGFFKGNDKDRLVQRCPFALQDLLLLQIDHGGSKETHYDFYANNAYAGGSKICIPLSLPPQ